MNRTELSKTVCRLMSVIFSENMGNCISEQEYYNTLSNWGIEKELFEKYVSFNVIIDCDYSENVQYVGHLHNIIEFITEQKINSRYGVQEFNIEQIGNDLYKVTLYYKQKFYENFTFKE